MARERWQRLVRLPILLSVGVGGLEPPTSASQTRRAGRLRYTPADKSIIRSMFKRQDARMRTLFRFLIIITAIFLALNSACNPVATQPAGENAPTTPKSTAETSHTPELSPSATSAPATATSTPTPTPDCRQTGGQLQKEKFFSEQLNADLYFILYLPPCYQEAQQEGFPVLYLLHGLSYNGDQWLRLGLVERMDALIAQGEIPPFIIVLPEEVRVDPPQVSSFPRL